MCHCVIIRKQVMMKMSCSCRFGMSQNTVFYCIGDFMFSISQIVNTFLYIRFTFSRYSCTYIILAGILCAIIDVWKKV